MREITIQGVFFIPAVSLSTAFVIKQHEDDHVGDNIGKRDWNLI
jgi:hypothetical protein